MYYCVFVGRPNAGKSSLIRKLTKHDPVVGKKPGSTRKINHYPITHNFEIIDVPGWGRIHGRTQKYENKIKDKILDFFETNAANIAACIHVIDTKSLIEVSERLAKKGIIPLDKELYLFLRGLELQPILAFNKIDKIPDFRVEQTIRYFIQIVYEDSPIGIPQEDIISVSATQNYNLDILRDQIRERFKSKNLEAFCRYIKV
ncbi:MAG: GTP-binding protein EngB [Asgard group archaeon]|nr:GTP-binding protein EngB [Asgard group archaeon]